MLITSVSNVPMSPSFHTTAKYSRTRRSVLVAVVTVVGVVSVRRMIRYRLPIELRRTDPSDGFGGRWPSQELAGSASVYLDPVVASYFVGL